MQIASGTIVGGKIVVDGLSLPEGTVVTALTKVETKRPDIVRRLHLPRVQYAVYYRVRGKFFDVIAFWRSSRETGPSLLQQGPDEMESGIADFMFSP